MCIKMAYISLTVAIMRFYVLFDCLMTKAEIKFFDFFTPAIEKLDGMVDNIYIFYLYLWTEFVGLTWVLFLSHEKRFKVCIDL